MSDTTTERTHQATKLSPVTMTAMVVGGMVGAGVFSLPSRFAQEAAGPKFILVGALIGVIVLASGWITL